MGMDTTMDTTVCDNGRVTSSSRPHVYKLKHLAKSPLEIEGHRVEGQIVQVVSLPPHQDVTDAAKYAFIISIGNALESEAVNIKESCLNEEKVAAPANLVTVGTLWLAKSQMRGEWGRGVVLALEAGESATVLFLDVGRRENLGRRSDLYYFPKRLLQFPPMSMYCLWKDNGEARKLKIPAVKNLLGLKTKKFRVYDVDRTKLGAGGIGITPRVVIEEEEHQSDKPFEHLDSDSAFRTAVSPLSSHTESSPPEAATTPKPVVGVEASQIEKCASILTFAEAHSVEVIPATVLDSPTAVSVDSAGEDLSESRFDPTADRRTEADRKNSSEIVQPVADRLAELTADGKPFTETLLALNSTDIAETNVASAGIIVGAIIPFNDAGEVVPSSDANEAISSSIDSIEAIRPSAATSEAILPCNGVGEFMVPPDQDVKSEFEVMYGGLTDLEENFANSDGDPVIGVTATDLISFEGTEVDNSDAGSSSSVITVLKNTKYMEDVMDNFAAPTHDTHDILERLTADAETQTPDYYGKEIAMLKAYLDLMQLDLDAFASKLECRTRDLEVLRFELNKF